MITEHDLEKLGESMRDLAELISRASFISIETSNQLKAFDRFMNHHAGMVQAAKANDADAFVKHLEAAYHAGRIIILGLRDEQIQIITGRA